MYKWVCSKCGYEIPVDKKLEEIERIPHDLKCPRCGADFTHFKLLHEEE